MDTACKVRGEKITYICQQTKGNHPHDEEGKIEGESPESKLERKHEEKREEDAETGERDDIGDLATIMQAMSVKAMHEGSCETGDDDGADESSQSAEGRKDPRGSSSRESHVGGVLGCYPCFREEL